MEHFLFVDVGQSPMSIGEEDVAMPMPDMRPLLYDNHDVLNVNCNDADADADDEDEQKTSYITTVKIYKKPNKKIGKDGQPGFTLVLDVNDSEKITFGKKGVLMKEPAKRKMETIKPKPGTYKKAK